MALAAVNKHPAGAVHRFPVVPLRGQGHGVLHRLLARPRSTRKSSATSWPTWWRWRRSSPTASSAPDPGQPFPKHLLDAITHVEDVDSFDGYPDKWLGKSEDIFDRDDLPLFRVQAGGAQERPRCRGPRLHHPGARKPRAARRFRFRAADPLAVGRHGVMSDKSNKVASGPHQGLHPGAGCMTWTYIILANLLAPKESPGASRRSLSSATASACSPTARRAPALALFRARHPRPQRRGRPRST
jgi:hypothetical protein